MFITKINPKANDIEVPTVIAYIDTETDYENIKTEFRNPRG